MIAVGIDSCITIISFLYFIVGLGIYDHFCYHFILMIYGLTCTNIKFTYIVKMNYVHYIY